MSIEDPRLSGIDNSSAADDFDTAVEQHLGFASETSGGMEVAQAEAPDAGRTDRLPAQAPVQTAAAVIPSEVAPNDENVVTLPAGIELDNLEFEVDGENLVLILADGTEIVVLGGAANIPTFVIGDVELPQVALFAALEGSNINVAAGPDGTFSALSAPDASRNFVDNQIDAGPEDFALAGLLGDANFGDDILFDDDGIDNGEPTAGDLGVLGYDEAALVSLSEADNVISGTLPFSEGGDFGTITAINLAGFGGAGLAGNVAEPGTTASAYPLTSGGLPLTIVTSTVLARDTVRGFVALEAFKTVVVGDATETVLVFRVTVTDRVTGEFTFELFEPLDHPDLNEADAADLLRLAFTFTVTDLDGDSDEGTFSIDIADDAATISVPVTVVDGVSQPTVGVVEEEHSDVDGPGNEDANGALDADSGDNPLGFSSTTHVATGGLGISWGADSYDLSDADDVGTLASLGNRTVSFYIPPTGGSEGQGPALAAAASPATGLTSNGYAVVYEYSADGKTLTAYRFEDGQYYDDAGLIISGESLGDAAVFQVVLDDNGSGSYTFTLYGTLDHNGEGEDALQLDFQFTATDSDGDVTAPSTFSVKVVDDVLEIGRPEREFVDEDGRPGLESGAGNPGPWGYHSDDSNGGTSERGDLNISWGADDSNATANGGVTGAKGDRGVAFTGDVAPEGVTSNGFGLFYAYNATRTELVAYRVDSQGYFIDTNGDRIPASSSEIPSLLSSEEGEVKVLDYLRLDEGLFPTGAAEQLTGAAVFEVSLSDAGSGSYTFTLIDNLDHRSQGEDNLDLNFGFTASDADGDEASSSFTVVVDDDTPVFYWFPEQEEVSERFIGETGDVERGNLYVSWGADNANSDVNGGATGLDGDRYIVFRTQSAPQNLTSNGIPLTYVVSDNGTTLTAYRFNGTQYIGPEGQLLGGQPTGDARVFEVTLSDQGTGSYTFTLIDNLDHVGWGQSSEIDLKFDFKAVDSDGDVLNGSFEVDVRDGGPSLGGRVSSSIVDEEGILGRGGNEGDSYIGKTGSAADASGTSTSTGNVALNINWGNDSDLKSERLNNGRVDDPIGRQVEFVDTRGNGVSVGTISSYNVAYILGQDFVGLKSGSQSLSYKIEYLLDISGNWNGGYLLTASAGQTPVFKVTLDPTSETGSYKFDLLGVLNHPNSGQAVNSENDIDLTFRFKAIDSDGDATDVGTFKVTVDDDAPVAGVVVVSNVELRHDETGGAQQDTADDKSTTVPSTFSNLGTVIGWAQQGGMVDKSGSAYGADGAGSMTLALTQANGSTFNGVNSGLQNLAGHTIQLYSQGNLVLGKIGGTVYFALSIDNSGTVSIAQYQPIKHDPNNSANDLESILNVHVTVTVTDRDGDVKSATTSSALDIKIVDDGPSVNPTQTGKTVDEDGLSTGNGARITYNGDAPETSASVSGTLAYSFGTDGKSGAADDIVFNTSSLNALNLESLGTRLTYSWDNVSNTLTAKAGHYGPTVFTLQVTNVDTGTFTFTLNRPLDHSDRAGANTEDDIDIDFGFTIKDGDGDTATGSIRITIDDDAPFIGTPDAERVSEASLPYTWGDEFNPNGSNSAYQTGNLAISWGADNQDNVWSSANRSVAFASGLTASGLTSDGETIRYEFNSDRTELTAVTGSGFGKEVIFTVKLNDDGSGTYEFRLFGNIDHAPNTSEKLLSFGFVAKDSDGDTASSSFNVTIEDQTASLGTAETKTVDEEFLSGSGNTGLEHTYPGDVLFNFTRVEGDLNINWGADDNNSGSTNNRSVRFDGYTNGANFGSVTSDGAQVKVWVGQDGTLYGYVGSNPSGNNVPAASARVFTVTLDDDGSGSYTFNLLGNLDHSTARLEDSLDLNFNFKVTDSDGDVTLGGTFKVIVNDDAARLTGAQDSTVDEDGTGLGNAQLPGANNSQVTGDAIGAPLRVTGKSLGIEWGADNNLKSETLTNGTTIDDPIGRTVAFANVLASQQGTALGVGEVGADEIGLGELTSGGMPLVYTISYLQTSGVWNGGYVLTATKGAGGIEIFKVTLDPTASNGAYSFELKGPLDHTFGDNIEGDLNLNFKFAAFDADGDPASGINFSSPISNGTFTVTVNDDSATARNDSYTVLEDSGTTSFNGANGLISNDLVGADGARLYQVKFGNGDFVNVVNSSEPQNGGYTHIVAGKGTYFFKLNGEWSFTPLANFNGTANFDYTLRDGDGDVSNAATVTVTITPVNDNPVANNDTFSVTEDQISAATSGLPRIIGNVLANDTDVDNLPGLNPVANTQTLTVASVYSVTISNGNNTGLALTLNSADANGVYKISSIDGDAYLKVEANGDIKMWTDTGEDPYKALGTTESDTITIGYTVTDSQNPTAGTAIATAVITIEGSNDNPTAVDDSFLGGIGGTFSDNFNAGNVGNRWTPTMIGNSSAKWTFENGVVKEDSNNAYGFLKAPTSVLPAGAVSSTVYRMEVDADPQNDPTPGPVTGNEAVGLVFGFTDKDNYYRAYWMSYDSRSQGQQDYRDLVLEKIVNGQSTILSKVDNVDFGNDMMKFVLSVGANGIRVEVTGNNRTEVLTSTDRPALGGYGLYSEDNDDGITYDNFSITVGGGAITTAEDTALTIQAADLLANDSDVDGDAITVVSVSPASVNGGVVSLVGGVITYTPAANFNGPDTFSYTISDNKGGTSTANVSINVTPVNDTPVAANDIYSTAEDTPLQVTIANGVLLNDVDVDGDTLSAMLETEPAHGRLEFTGAGTFVYTPNANYNGSDSFTYKVYDTNGAFSNIATVTINVTPVNDAPVIVSTPVQIVNAGFEANTNYTNSGSEGQWGNASPIGWTVSGPSTGAGWFDPTPNGAGGSEAVLPMAPGNGNNVLFLNDGQQAAQTLNATAQAGTYNLSVEVGDRAENNLTGLPAYTIRLYAGSTVVGEYTAPAQQANGPAWQTVQLQGVIPAGSALIGQNLRIEIVNLEAPGAGGDFQQTTQVNFDNLNLTYTASLLLNAITEDDTGNAGQTVASLLGASVTDVDAGAVEGIAVTGADDGNGTWQYFNGSNWVNFGTYTEGQALLLRADDLVRFQPNGTNGTTASFDFVAWDQTYGDAFTTENVAVRGGTTAFSSETAQATIIVSSVNDAAIISGDTTGTVYEATSSNNAVATITGDLNATDVDNPADTWASGLVTLDFGTFEIASDGKWSYVLDNMNLRVDGLKDGEHLIDTITVRTMDGTSQVVTITINGTNDVPVLAGLASSMTFAENTVNAAPQIIDVDVSLTDVDSSNFDGGNLTVSGFLAGEDTIGINNQGNGVGQVGISGGNVLFGGVVIGTFTGGSGANNLVVAFNGNASVAAVDALIQNLTYANSSDNPNATRSLTIVVTDGDGGTSAPATSLVSVTLDNDTASISGTEIGTVTEDGNVTAGGTLTVADPDNGENQFELPASLAGTYGTFTFNATTGVWGYTLNNTALNVQELNTGSEVYDVLTVQSIDGTATQVIQVTINGKDEPVTVSVNEATSATGRYAFVDTNDGTPNAINFNAASLFTGLSSNATFTFERVNTTNKNDSWMTRNSSTGAVTGNPPDNRDGLYIYKVTATDGGVSHSTYAAFSAIEDGGRRFEISNNGGSSNSNSLAYANDRNGDGDLILIESNINSALNAGDDDDVVVGSANTETINGGDGDDALYGMGGIDMINGEDGADFIDGGAGNDVLRGGSGDDVILGGAGNDTIYGGTGRDILVGGTGADTFVWSEITSSNVSSNADTIVDYNRVEGDVIDLGSINPGNVRVRTSSENTNDLVVQVSGNTVYTLKGAATDGVDKVLIKVGGISYKYGDDNVRTLAADPIILDLDKNGFAFSSIADGVTFDIDVDGKGDQIAWTSDDGILAYDVDGDGLIDNGSEIFTPDFNGGKFASGVAALASLDANGDGKIDEGDDAFKDLKIWIDANNNGVSDEGELSSLSDNRVTSISLTTDQTGGEEDGQTIFAEGEFTFADGSTGNFLEVGFDTIFGSEPEGLTLHGGMGEVMMTGTDGADTFVFDATALDELDVADVITDFSSEEGDVLDVTALLDSLLGEPADEATAASHLRASVDEHGNTTVSVQADANDWKDLVVLQNHEAAIKVLFDDKHVTVTPHD